GQHHQRLAAFLLEGHRGDRPVFPALFVRPHEARRRCHFRVPAVERHRLRGPVLEHELILAPGTNVHVARQQRQAERLRDPPLLEQLGLGPRLKHDPRWAVDRARHDELTRGFPLRCRAVLHGCGLTCGPGLHCLSPCVSVYRPPAPIHRSARRKAMETRTASEPTPMKNRTTSERKSPRELVVSRTINGPTRIVFEAWTKPELFKQWWVPKSFGLTLLSCDMDVRPGGKYKLVFKHGASEPMAFYGRYTEVTPPAR